MLASVTGATRRRRGKVAAVAPETEGIPTAVESPRPEPASEPAAVGPPPVGAYIPPGTASSSPLLLMPARAWAGITSGTPRPMAAVGLTQAMAGSTSIAHAQTVPGPVPGGAHGAIGPASASAPGVAEVRSDGDQAGWLEAAAGWLMIIGSAVAMLGFLLPWSRSVIGAEGAGTYFDTWGIASPSHLLVELSLAAVLGLAIVANPIPTWIRTACAGLVLGGLLVGLAWPYLLGPLGAGPGVLAILVGGVLLVSAGILDLVEARHVPTAMDV